MKYGEALKLIGGLSRPSKMPWWGWSISALDCQTGSKLREIEGSVCNKCYAMKGNYRFPGVLNAHSNRRAALDNPRFVEAFILVLTTLYEKQRGVKENRFRWHDSGDIQGPWHLKIINDIALATPFLDHWLPTKEPQFVKEFLKTNKLAENLIIRVSNPMVGVSFKKPPLGLHASTVGVNDAPNQCPAYNQGGKCLDCRKCWTKSIGSVNYKSH